MFRPVSLLAALVAAAAFGVVGLPAGADGATAAAAAPAEDDAPLQVSIDSMSPSAMPRSGRIRLSGEITNTDDQAWSTINVYPFISYAPMTTVQELADAAEVDPTAQVGERVSGPGGAPYDTIDELAPGESAPYAISVPRKQIPGGDAAGVYWFGVHALGQDASGRDLVADGRARTFLPVVPRSAGRVDTALVVPIRSQVEHRADGRIADVRAWRRSLDHDGRLRSLVDFGAAAGSRPINWLLDPAVTDAAQSLVQGNPARSLAPTIQTGGGEGNDDDSDSAAEPADGVDSAAALDNAGPRAQTLSQVAGDWLERLHSALESSEILSLPYGDVDVAAAAVHSPQTYRVARDRSGSTLAPWGLPTSPAVSAPTGYLSAAAIELIDPDTTALVTDTMVGDPTAGDSGSPVLDADGRTLVAASSGAVSGGPGPDDPDAPVAFRQRLLAEAAVRAIAPTPEPLVVLLPGTWQTASPTDFFDGLDVGWLRLRTLDSITAGGGTDVDVDRLDYPEAQSRLELDSDDFEATSSLMLSGETLQNLLTLNDRVAGTVRDEALTDVSYNDRLHHLTARDSADASRAWIEQRLDAVHVEARAVILSSGSGRFSATVENTLDQPVTVRLDAATEPPLRVSVPGDSLDVAAGSRASILLNASSSAIGTRTVRLSLTDTDGTPLGSYDDVPIRSTRVSNVIWLILGTGIALLLGAIVVRLFRRIRTARRS